MNGTSDEFGISVGYTSMVIAPVTRKNAILQVDLRTQRIICAALPGNPFSIKAK